jgi:hypothetical protein
MKKLKLEISNKKDAHDYCYLIYIVPSMNSNASTIYYYLDMM